MAAAVIAVVVSVAVVIAVAAPVVDVVVAYNVVTVAVVIAVAAAVVDVVGRTENLVRCDYLLLVLVFSWKLILNCGLILKTFYLVRLHF